MPEGLVVFGQKGFDLLDGFHRASPFSILGSSSGSVFKGFVVSVQQRFDFLDDLHESPSFLPPRLFRAGCFSFWHYNNTRIVKSKIPKTSGLLYLFDIAFRRFAEHRKDPDNAPPGLRLRNPEEPLTTGLFSLCIRNIMGGIMISLRDNADQRIDTDAR